MHNPQTPAATTEYLTPECVGSIYCVGRNYGNQLHGLEGHPGEPVIFSKSPATIVPLVGQISLPVFLGRIDFEIELAIIIGRDIDHQSLPIDADCISHFGAALDLTRRGTQAMYRKKGAPWELSKSFPNACPITPFQPLSHPDQLSDWSIELKVDEVRRQIGHAQETFFSVVELVNYLARWLPLKQGDMLMTGTPAGVAPIQDGAHLAAYLNQHLVGEATFIRV